MSGHYYKKTDPLPAEEVRRLADAWIVDGQYRQLSRHTQAGRKNVVQKLAWWMAREGVEALGADEVRRFLAYVATGHGQAEGRWGSQWARMTRPVRPITIKHYHRQLQVMFRWLVREEYLERNPIERVRPPLVRRDAVQPFSAAQVEALLTSAEKTSEPLRDAAVVLFLLDTGVRAAELCGLRLGELDVPAHRAVVTGKGNKRRPVYFGSRTSRALLRYLRSRETDADKGLDRDFAVFHSQHGTALTPSGLHQLIQRLGRASGIEAVRCSPHTLRHTFAVSFLRAGGHVFALKELMGHNTLAVTSRYVALAQADLQAQHAQFSPVETMKLRKGTR